MNILKIKHLMYQRLYKQIIWFKGKKGVLVKEEREMYYRSTELKKMRKIKDWFEHYNYDVELSFGITHYLNTHQLKNKNSKVYKKS